MKYKLIIITKNILRILFLIMNTNIYILEHPTINCVHKFENCKL